MYVVQKVTGERVFGKYPFFRYIAMRDQVLKDPEFKKQNKMGKSKTKLFR